jgi:hypothetical protein
VSDSQKPWLLGLKSDGPAVTSKSQQPARQREPMPTKATTLEEMIQKAFAVGTERELIPVLSLLPPLKQIQYR